MYQRKRQSIEIILREVGTSWHEEKESLTLWISNKVIPRNFEVTWVKNSQIKGIGIEQRFYYKWQNEKHLWTLANHWLLWG